MTHPLSDTPLPSPQTMDRGMYVCSLALGLLSGARKHACYGNAWHAIATLPACLASTAALVEGWLVLSQAETIWIIEHGWCLCHGKLLDPTVGFLTGLGQPLFSCAGRYFPGLLHSCADGMPFPLDHFPHVRRTERYAPVGLGHGGYAAAYLDACTHAARLARSSKPAKRISIVPMQFI